MSLGTLALIVLVILLLGGFSSHLGGPTWPIAYGYGYGNRGIGVLGVVIIIVLLFVLLR